MSMTPKNPTLPAPSTVMVWEEFVQVTGIDPERLHELLALGWLETRGAAERQHLFRDGRDPPVAGFARFSWQLRPEMDVFDLRILFHQG